MNTVAPSITGTVQRAAVLTAARGTWTGNNNLYSYQWQRDGVDIADATGAGYTLTVDDVGKRVRVVVTATNPDATVTAASAPTVSSRAPAGQHRPADRAGTAQRGLTLTGTAGVWDRHRQQRQVPVAVVAGRHDLAAINSATAPRARRRQRVGRSCACS